MGAERTTGERKGIIREGKLMGRGGKGRGGKLEEDGLLNRKVYPQIPPKVEYKLTERGHSLMPHLHALVDWASENISEIKIAREEYEKSPG